MRYRREGYPGEGELVLCTVTKILHHAVFGNLDEYDKGGLIHISEVAPGRIRNIRDYVEMGKKVVCKILRVDKEKGYIDLSLRRVTDMEKKRKLEEIKQEQKAEKIIEMASKELGGEVEEVYNSVTDKVFERYPFVYLFFRDVAEGKSKIEEMELDKKLGEVLKGLIEERFKPAKVEVKGYFMIKSYAPNGVEMVKKALLEAEKASSDGIVASIAYIGGGKYKAKVEASNYKEAESVLGNMEEKVKGVIKTEGEVSFTREE